MTVDGIAGITLRPAGRALDEGRSRREEGAWKIAHGHSSVPFLMDGSFRAATDLKPDGNA